MKFVPGPVEREWVPIDMGEQLEELPVQELGEEVFKWNCDIISPEIFYKSTDELTHVWER